MKFRKNLALLAVFVICSYALASFAAPENDEVWKKRMRDIAAAVAEMMPIVSSEKAFNDPAQGAKLKKVVDQLSVLAKDLNDSLNRHSQKKDGHAADPLFQFASAAFLDDVESAKEVLATGDKRYAQSVLRNTLSYCTSCHTRSESKSSYEVPVFAATMKNLNIFERMQMLVSARQFDAALKDFNAQLSPANSKKSDSLETENAARLAVAVAVRVNDDPAAAIALIENVRKAQKISADFQAELGKWVKGLQQWQKTKTTLPKSEEELFAAGKTLVERAQAKERSNSDRTAEIDYLRGTALLHDLLERYPKTSHLGESFFLLGRSYETLQQLGLWSLHEVYFEACVKTTPHTPLAKKCFTDFKESKTMGYTGSAGTNIPPTIAKRIATLKTLSEPAAKATATPEAPVPVRN